MLQVVEELELPEGSTILSDRIGFLPTRLSCQRQNPMGDAVREIRVRTETGKVLRILSNDLDAPAQEIADLYKRRWAIELFFRWVKQVLDIKHFLGRSENAVRIQIAAALIAFLLLRFAQATQKIVLSPLAFARLVRRTSCTAAAPTSSSSLRQTRQATPDRWCSNGPEFKPDSRHKAEDDDA